jgi:tRNA (cytidine/uridine-2'-O-)-methyltransferase
MRLALFQPDIPQNVGACIRLSACFGAPLEVIRPTAFALDDRSLKRAALDYGPLGHMTVRESWSAFLAAPERSDGRLILFTTSGAVPLHDFAFAPGDTLLFGRESAGAPPEVHAAANARVVIPIRPETRSLNLAVSAGIALWEAVRQCELSSRTPRSADPGPPGPW